MNKKYVWALVAVAVVAATVWALVYYGGLSRISNFVSSMRSPAAQTLGTPEAGPLTYVPAEESIVTTPGFVSPESTPAGAVVAISPTSITVQTPTGQKSFAISANTPVYSTVLVGEVGKSLADISVGSIMVVFWRASDPSAAVSLAFSRDEALSLTAEDNNRILSGIVVEVTDSEVVIVPADETLSPVSVAITADTLIASTVLAGQTGRSLAQDDIVVARGVSSTDGRTTAKAIVIAPPLP